MFFDFVVVAVYVDVCACAGAVLDDGGVGILIMRVLNVVIIMCYSVIVVSIVITIIRVLLVLMMLLVLLLLSCFFVLR